MSYRKSKNGRVFISEKQFEAIDKIGVLPFQTYREIYNYLSTRDYIDEDRVKRKIIDFSFSSFQKMISDYRTNLNNGVYMSKKTYKGRTPLKDYEVLFCEKIEYLKTASISVVKMKAFQGAMNDKTGKQALEYLKFYDLQHRRKLEDIKRLQVEVEGEQDIRQNVNIQIGFDNGESED